MGVLNLSNDELSKAKEDMLSMLEEMKVEQEKSKKIREEVDSLKHMVESYSLLLTLSWQGGGALNAPP